MKQKLFTLLTLLVFVCTGAWSAESTATYVVKDQGFTGTETNGGLNKTISGATFAFGTAASLQDSGENMKIKIGQNGTITLTAPSGKGIKSIQMVLASGNNSAKWNGSTTGCSDGTSEISGSWLKGSSAYSISSNLSNGTYTFTPTYATFGKNFIFTLGTKSSSNITITSLSITYVDPELVGNFSGNGFFKVESVASNPTFAVSATDGASLTEGVDYTYTLSTDNSSIVTISGNAITDINTAATGVAKVTAEITSLNATYLAPAANPVLFVYIYSENRTYSFDAPTSADMTALKGNSSMWKDETGSDKKYVTNKVQFDKDKDYAFEGADGKDLSIAQGILISNTANVSAGDYRYYYKDDNYYFYTNKSNTTIKVPNVESGQKVILTMSAGGDKTITATNATPASYSYKNGSGTVPVSFIASADGTVSFTNTGGSYNIYSIEVRTPVYYTVEYNLNGGTGTTPTETNKEEGDKFNLHDGTTGITAPDGKVFDGWNDGTSTYAGGEEYTMPGDDVTLTAQWRTPAVKHHVTYDLNGGTGTTPTQDDVEEGQTFEVASGTTGITAPDGKVFSTWNDGSADYAPGSTYTMSTSDVTLTAQWANLYTITYDKGANGTGSISNGQKTEGVAFTLSSEMFTREGYVQTGWATSDGGAKAYNLGGSYTDNADITLYPVWEGVASNGFAFTYGVSAPAGWTFSTDDGWADNKKIAAYVKDFTDNSVAAPGDNGMKDGWVAFAKNTSACATYDLGSAVTVAGITATLYGGSSSAFDQKIKYIAADGSTVLKEYTNSLGAGNWTANSISKTDIVANVRYIKVYGASKWVVMSNFTVSYGTASSSDPVSITPTKEYTTYIPSYGLDFTGNTKLSAYIATAASASTVTMTKVDKVPAGTPIILKATETGSPIDVNKASSTDDVSSNKLMASDGSTSIGGNGKWDYILSNGVFYHASAGVLPAGKCYLHLDAEPTGANELTMDFGDGSVTNIANINALKSEVNGEYYNLAGQRIAQPTKGLYITNGKKVIVK